MIMILPFPKDSLPEIVLALEKMKDINLKENIDLKKKNDIRFINYDILDLIKDKSKSKEEHLDAIRNFTLKAGSGMTEYKIPEFDSPWKGVKIVFNQT